MIADPEEREFVMSLREEAEGVKDCFTQFSYRTIAFSAAALAAMFATLERFPLVSLAAIPVVGFLMTVARIGIYKYSTSNRNFGYELHLARTEGIDYEGEGSWKECMRRIRWETALRAWRVVQPVLFRRIYTVPENYFPMFGPALVRKSLFFRWLNDKDPRQYRLRSEASTLVMEFREAKIKGEVDPEQARYPWFLLKELTLVRGRDANDLQPIYHAGTYLKNMLRILIMMQFLVLLPMTFQVIERVACIEYSRLAGQKHLSVYGIVSLAVDLGLVGLVGRLAVFLLLLVMVWVGAVNVSRRRKILESELLSIHSTAITWQAVILCHYRSMSSQGKGRQGEYLHYTERLVRHAERLAENAFTIHSFVKEKSSNEADDTNDGVG